MSAQESRNENTELSNELIPSKSSKSGDVSPSSLSGTTGRSNLRSRWKRKSSEIVNKPSSEGQFSYGEVSNPSAIKENLSGKEAFTHSIASNERIEPAPVMKFNVTEEPLQDRRPSTSHVHHKHGRSRKFEDLHPGEEAEVKKLAGESKPKVHERFEDYKPDANNVATEDYTLNYSRHSSKKFQKTQSSKQSNKFAQTGRPERNEGQRTQGHAKSHDRYQTTKKGLLEKISGFFAGILGVREEPRKTHSGENAWEKRLQQEGSSGKPSRSSHRYSHPSRSRSKGGFNKRSRGSIKG